MFQYRINARHLLGHTLDAEVIVLHVHGICRQANKRFGYLAFAALAQQCVLRASAPLVVKQPHFPARARHVIFLCMQGAPSYVDLLDYKPKLRADSGKNAPPAASCYGQAKLMKSPWKFNQHGNNGLWISELLPNLAKHADDRCIIHSMATDLPAHPQAFMQPHSCSAFLPVIYQGTKISGTSIPGSALGQRYVGGSEQASFANIKNPLLSTEAQRTQLDLVQSLNQTRMRELLFAADFIVAGEAGQNGQTGRIGARPTGGTRLGILQIKNRTTAGFPTFAAIEREAVKQFVELPVILIEHKNMPIALGLRATFDVRIRRDRKSVV